MRIQTRLLLFAATGMMLVLLGGEAIGLSTGGMVTCAAQSPGVGGWRVSQPNPRKLCAGGW